MSTLVQGVVRRHGKPFNYFQLGKGFREGADFMRHMRTAAESLMRQAIERNAVRRVERCPICGAEQTEHRLNVAGYDYVQCPAPECRHAFVATVVDDEIRRAFFEDDKQYSRRNYCDPSRSEFRLANIAEPKVAHVLEFVGDGASRWLDVGCGSGEILAVLKTRGGWEAVGLELSRQDAAFGCEFYSVDIREQLLDAFRAQNADRIFDVVSMFGVLHCVDDPVALAREAADAIAPGGVMVTEVTNYESVLARAVATHPEHPTRSSFNGATTLHQFTEASIQRTLCDAGLEPISVWYYGTDVFEVLNQWCFSDEAFPESPLEAALSELANDTQAAIDQREQSSNMLWIARKPD
jgi:SAM-dependent methyltransferase